MNTTITVIQVIISLILAGLIIVQSQGTGLGSAFGGGGEMYRSKRGLEKVLFRLTIIFAALFFLSSLVNFVVT